MNTRRLYGFTLAGYFGLLILIIVSNGWLAPPTHFPRALAILFLGGPLLLPLRGLLHGRPYTFAWASYLALVYLIFGIVNLMASPGERLPATIQVVSSFMMYLGAILYARYRSRELRG